MVSKHVSGILGKRKSSKFVGMEGKKGKIMDWDEMVKETEVSIHDMARITSLAALPPGSRIEYKDRIYIKTNLTPFYCDIDNGNMVKVERILDGTIIRRGEG